jgi:hypothetical protein
MNVIPLTQSEGLTLDQRLVEKGRYVAEVEERAEEIFPTELADIVVSYASAPIRDDFVFEKVYDDYEVWQEKRHEFVELRDRWNVDRGSRQHETLLALQEGSTLLWMVQRYNMQQQRESLFCPLM